MTQPLIRGVRTEDGTVSAYCAHNSTYGSNDQRKEHVMMVLDKMLPKIKGNLGWVLSRMNMPELCFISSILDDYSASDLAWSLEALESQLGGSTSNSRQMIFARIVMAPLFSHLMESDEYSEVKLVDEVKNSLPVRCHSVVPLPHDCDSVRFLGAHVASQRGSFLQRLILRDPDKHFLDVNHAVWLGEHYKDVLPLRGQLRLRDSVDPVLVATLVKTGLPLSEGAL